MNHNRMTILIIDDDDSIRWVLSELLTDEGFKVLQAADVSAAWQLLNHDNVDLLMTDIRMPDGDGLELLQRCRQAFPNLPVIVMTAHADLESAVDAYQQGAYEYLPKPFDLDEVQATVQRALQARVPAPDNKPKPVTDRYQIIGESAAMQKLYRAIGRLAKTPVTVLIHGESGTGKELVARALHQHSPRKQAPFIALNMAAIPHDLIESELFGHEKGAFTGANSRYLGRFEQANGGTLFLDEIGDMPLQAQTRLLRVLSEGVFYRLGSTQPTKVDVRIVAATHQNLAQKVTRGEFREDLYHRLNVIPLTLPPLRERREDLLLLANHFFERIAAELDEPAKSLDESALLVMQNYPWPGNVRELENTCRWLSVMVKSNIITAAELPDNLRTNVTDEVAALNWREQLKQNIMATVNDKQPNALRGVQLEIEQLLIEIALQLSGGKKAEAANLLGWGRNTLTRKLKGKDRA